MSNANSNPSSTVKYFDFVTTGVGYLNSVNVISKQGGIGCKITALVGSAEEAERRSLQLNVTGALANAQIASLKASIVAGKKVIVGFSVGELRPHQFTYEKGEKIGQTGLVLKGRLIKLTFAKVDGEIFQLANLPAANADAVVQESQPVEKHTDLPVAAAPVAEVPVNTGVSVDDEVEVPF